jgi:hypothetical protein
MRGGSLHISGRANGHFRNQNASYSDGPSPWGVRSGQQFRSILIRVQPNAMQPIPSSRPRVVLTASQAKEIYMHKIMLETPDNFVSCLHGSRAKGQSVPISKMYNVSAKTIRDIWNRRTWTFATCHLWHLSRHERTESQVTFQSWWFDYIFMIRADTLHPMHRLVTTARNRTD